MKVLIITEPLFYLDLEAVLQIKNTVCIKNSNILVSIGRIKVSFSESTVVPDGDYAAEKLNANEIKLTPIGVPTVQQIELLEAPIGLVNSFPKLPVRIFNLIKKRKEGRKFHCLTFPNGDHLLTCENLSILVSAPEKTTAKVIEGIPASVFQKLQKQADDAGVSLNRWIIQTLATKKSDILAFPLVMLKNLTGVPVSHMIDLKARAAASKTSVNALILGLIRQYLGETEAPAEPTRDKLVSGIPTALMTELKTRASEAGISVNKYIKEVLKNA